MGEKKKEEKAEVDGALKLTKRKKTKKDIPPDLKAVQMLLGESGAESYAQWSEEDLEKEKQRLLGLLQEGETVKKTTATAKDGTARKKSVVKRKTEFNQNR